MTQQTDESNKDTISKASKDISFSTIAKVSDNAMIKELESRKAADKHTVRFHAHHLYKSNNSKPIRKE